MGRRQKRRFKDERKNEQQKNQKQNSKVESRKVESKNKNKHKAYQHGLVEITPHARLFSNLSSGQNTPRQQEPFITVPPKRKKKSYFFFPKKAKTRKTKSLHDGVGRPENAVTVELFGGVEPESVPLFSPAACASVSVQIGLEPPRLPFHVSQELEVQLIVAFLEYVSVRCLFIRKRN